MSAREEIFNKIEKFRTSVISALTEIAELDVTCKSIIEQHLNDSNSLNSKSIQKIQAVIDYMYEQVNIGNWKEVRLYLRKTLTIATFLRLKAYLKVNDIMSDNIIKEALLIIDFGILFGCPLDREPNLLQLCASCLHSYLKLDDQYEQKHVTERKIIINSETQSKSPYNCKVLDVLDCPSMEHFFRNYILAEKPIVIDNCLSHWPAITKWQDQSYFIKLAGLRTVSIELGKDYTDSNWTQKLMTLEEFIKNHIYNENGTTGYLAQYQLFDQIPELRKDIIEPEYCSFSETNDPVDVMAWYGPKGTVSPLHHDPKKNLLAQVVGEKLVFIFSPQDSEYLYPHEHELLNNTARIDPRTPNFEKFPKYKDANGYYCLLKAGQMLYIPPKWWHFVESQSVSFSVSFWWE